nr:HEAT repeat domain-containing protein [Streptomyces sp. S-9]
MMLSPPSRRTRFQGLRSALPAVRGRAVRCLVEIPGERATALLRDALGDADPSVRRTAALELGARGVAQAMPELVGMVVEEANDVDAADALGTLAGDAAVADRVVAELADRLADPAVDASARRRLTQALAEIPGPAATHTLRSLTGDGDRTVALTARYVLELRGSG